jgi:hypothetical protein
MAPALEADPEVRRAIDELHGSLPRERRSAPRESFRVVQRIAQANGGKVPEQTAFFPVRCHDLSTRGFSFIVKRRPQFKSLVLALGTPPGVIYLAAEVRHCTDVVTYPSGKVEILDDHSKQIARDSRSGKRVELGVLVGCQFTRRLGPHHRSA